MAEIIKAGQLREYTTRIQTENRDLERTLREEQERIDSLDTQIAARENELSGLNERNRNLILQCVPFMDISSFELIKM